MLLCETLQVQEIKWRNNDQFYTGLLERNLPWERKTNRKIGKKLWNILDMKRPAGGGVFTPQRVSS